MPQYPVYAAKRSLVDAVSRDLVIALLVVGICAGLESWYLATGSTISLVVAWIVTFILAFFVTYLLHEWGHYIGARLAGADIPFGPANGVLLGLFDNAAHSRKQFMWMAMGGEIGYLLPALVVIPVFWDWVPLQGLALGVAGFVVQALYVDVPILWKIYRGAEIQITLDAGLGPKIILRKTLIGWTLMGLAIAGYFFLAG